MKYRKLPVEVEAVRYGDADGNWHDKAIEDLATFMLGHPPNRDSEIIDVIRPRGGVVWNPPVPPECSIEIWDGVAHQEWLPVALGDFVIRGRIGEFYPCKPDIFEATYEPVGA